MLELQTNNVMSVLAAYKEANRKDLNPCLHVLPLAPSSSPTGSCDQPPSKEALQTKLSPIELMKRHSLGKRPAEQF